MSTRKEIEKRVEKKQEEIRHLEVAIREARSYIQALQDTLRLLPRESDCAPAEYRQLRKGSEMEKVRLLLLKAGKPMYIEDILTALGKEITKEHRNAIAGSLSGYSRRGVIFTRPEPGTFGLVDFANNDLPDDFGTEPEGADSTTGTSPAKE